ncbi:MAG: UPF0179 family protein [Thermoplasmata archaeon]|nr:MAG: UPF0179 family protein [Thermoplasmata archaeon]
MANVTLIGEKQAKKGNEFIYFGPLPECRDCKVKTVCFNLEEGRTYRVTEVRSMHHNCKIYEEGVRAIEFEKLDLKLAVDSKQAVENNEVIFEGELCENRNCKFFKICFPSGLKSGEKYLILTVGEEIDCVLGKDLKEVKV